MAVSVSLVILVASPLTTTGRRKAGLKVRAKVRRLVKAKVVDMVKVVPSAVFPLLTLPTLRKAATSAVREEKKLKVDPLPMFRHRFRVLTGPPSSCDIKVTKGKVLDTIVVVPR